MILRFPIRQVSPSIGDRISSLSPRIKLVLYTRLNPDDPGNVFSTVAPGKSPVSIASLALVDIVVTAISFNFVCLLNMFFALVGASWRLAFFTWLTCHKGSLLTRSAPVHYRRLDQVG